MSARSTPARRLVVLRHAKAEREPFHSDRLRPLSLVGRRQAGGVGARLAADGVVPELVLVSSAVRTHQTWDLMRAQLGPVEPEVLLLDDLYDADVERLLSLVQGTDDRVRSVLVVGHEPTVSRTAARLAGDGSDPSAVALTRVGVPTATFATLEFDAPWATLGPGTARLRTVVTIPKNASATFGRP